MKDITDRDISSLEAFAFSTRFASARAEPEPEAKEYWTRGYLHLRGLFTPEEIAAWSAECDRLLKLDLVKPDNIRTQFRMNSGNCPERIDPVVDISPLFSELTRDPRVVDRLQMLFRDKPLLFKDKLIFKTPGTHGYTMHQDQPYWQLCAADDILSVSLQIDGATAENGCIELFAGYHQRMLTPVGKRTNFRPEELALVDPADGVKIDTQPGDVLIFHSLTPHQSGTNVANVSRRSLYLTYSAARHGDFYEEQQKNYREYSAEQGRGYFK